MSSPIHLGFTCVFLKILVFGLFPTDTLSSLLLFENCLYAQIPAATSKQAGNTPPIPVPIESELSLPCLSVDEIHLGMKNLAPHPTYLCTPPPNCLPLSTYILHFPLLYLQNYNQDHMYILSIVNNVLRGQFPKEYPYLVQFMVVFYISQDSIYFHKTTFQ